MQETVVEVSTAVSIFLSLHTEHSSILWTPVLLQISIAAYQTAKRETIWNGQLQISLLLKF